MDNRRTPVAILIAAMCLGIVAALPTSADAQVKPGKQAAPPNQVGRPGKGAGGGHQDDQSDQLMKQAAKLCMQAHKTMQKALPIYNGHRHMAMELTKMAVQDIRMGLQWNRQNGNAPMASAEQQAAGIQAEQEQNPNRYSQAQIQASNQKMIEAGRMLEKAKALLQSASHEYGGYRAQAIQFVEFAMVEIKRCLSWIGGRGN